MPRVRDARLARLAAEKTLFDSTTCLDRSTLRAWNTVCALVRDGLVRAGVDPESATAVRLGGAAAHIADIGDTAEMRRPDEELAAGEDDGLANVFRVRIGDIARRFQDGHEPDFASASLAELFAWCVARKSLQRVSFSGKPPSSPIESGGGLTQRGLE
jgi:hypothetical protein